VSSVGYVLTPPPTQASLTAAMSLKVAGEASTPSRIKVFQFAQNSLQLDHCSISRPSLIIEENGFWRFTCQAVQNPLVQSSTALTTVLPSTTQTPVMPTFGQPVLPTAPIRGLPAVEMRDTAFLKRNLFVIRIRGLGDFKDPIPVTPAAPLLGKPVLVELPVIEFWVQNGVPYPLVKKAVAPDLDVHRFFDMVDRAEVEFSYR
jgi:hypothetical protein